MFFSIFSPLVSSHPVRVHVVQVRYDYQFVIFLRECSKVSPKDQQQGAVADMMRLAGIVEVTAINFEKVRVPNVDYAVN